MSWRSTPSTRVFDGYRFVKVEDATLPLPDESFDIVVSNHVMEHVGTVADQVQHFSEIRRVMAPGGAAYVAVPNRWRVIEPHFHLRFLSWLPPRLANRYVRVSGKGEWYEVVPPSARRMKRLLTGAGLP
jgi:SAM-dependent methyltransferase